MFYREKLSHVASYLMPKYVAKLLITLDDAFEMSSIHRMSKFIREGDSFRKSLAMTFHQLYGIMPSASLNPTKLHASLAAGLPHFTESYMRCWGRDTFISLRGLMLLTGKFEAAREHLIAFASCVRHGLIPNLLDNGRYPRYNSRDAVWWYLNALKEYCLQSNEGWDFLKISIPLRFPDGVTFIEPTDINSMKNSRTLFDIVQMIMEYHANGIHFREWNAGRALDELMQDAGFQVNIELDHRLTGFLFGGNRLNCGTWMDKMGSSHRAGNHGWPATPRDGAPVELVGLLKSVLDWLVDGYRRQQYPYDGVLIRTRQETNSVDPTPFRLTFEGWSQLVQSHFESHFFYAPLPDSSSPPTTTTTNDSFRPFYRDTVGGSDPASNHQLRPNFLIAMVISPELFHTEHAWNALQTAETYLLGPYGMKTLDPRDPAYRPDYDPDHDNDDFTTSKGFNYHQGPEWLWLAPYFYRAKLIFAQRSKNKARLRATIEFVKHALPRYRHLLLSSSSYLGLPELTNGNGRFCSSSCASQAWSSATFLELLYDLKRMRHMNHAES